MNNNELLPCPFCGGEAEIDYRLGVCSVFCNGCGARVSSFGDVNPAVDAWNTRNYKEKQHSSKEMPLVPKWQENEALAWIMVEVSQFCYLEFEFKKHPKILYFYIQNKIDNHCYYEEIGTFNTLEEAKQKANECIRELGERLVYFSNNIKTEE